MSRWRWAILGASLAAAGCVHGYGACLFMQPVKHTLTGKVHFRTYPADRGMDNVPVLVLDRTAYLYSPAQSFIANPPTSCSWSGCPSFRKTWWRIPT